MKFKMPCEWKLRTIEEVEARTLVEAERKVTSLMKPKTLKGAKIEPAIGVVDWKELQRMYPFPKPMDPMTGWKVLSTPDPYKGGQWEKSVYGCKVTVTGDPGPIEVGMGFTTYTWSVTKPGIDGDFTSKDSFHRIEEARDAGLKAAERWSKMSG